MSLIGQTIRGYAVEELIGQGGFGTVYRATQPLVQREVAIKVISPQYASNPDFVRRFEVEAQLVARLESIHIVPLYDYWRDPDGAYLVMRWLRGGNLAQALRTGGWSLSDVARLLEQIASALHVAHRNGVVHRDLKPGNVLLDEDGNGYLADFGIAAESFEVVPQKSSKPETIIGSPPYMSPEQILREPLTPQSDIYSLGIVLFQMLTGTLPFTDRDDYQILNKHLVSMVPPLQDVRADLPIELNIVIYKATAKQPAARYRDATEMAIELRQIIQRTQRPEITLQRSVISVDTENITGGHTAVLEAVSDDVRNPYKGLRAFQESDAGDFFGRDAYIQILEERVHTKRFVAVVGASGSGKSSVVRAGLIPKILRGQLPDSQNWFVTTIVPGTQPLLELEAALLRSAIRSVPALRELLREAPVGLHTAVQAIFPSKDAELVLVIDQFEELFTQVRDETQRILLLDLLSYAISTPDSRLRLVITLRADFYNQPLLHPAFGQLLLKATEIIYPLTTPELERVILGPAERVGLTLELGLFTAIIADVAHQPGALPLVQFAITELFERRQGRKLTLQAYLESGGVLGALARRAEDVYNGLTDDEREITRQLFLRLVSAGDGAQQDTRKRVVWSDLLVKNEMLVRRIMDEFAVFRLLTFDRDPMTREPTVEIAHEALITQWQRLTDWVNVAREDLQTHRRLSLAVQDWQRAHEDVSYLASGVRLDAFADLLNRTAVVMNAGETAYVRASLLQRQQQTRRSRLVMTALVAFSIAALGLALFAFDRQQRADQQASVATSRQLAVMALNSLDRPDLALLLSLQGLRVADTFEARGSLLTALQQQPYRLATWYGHTDWVTRVVFTPDGNFLASVSRDGTVRLWNTHTGSGRILEGHEQRVWSAAFSPDGMTLATGDAGGMVILWDVESGTEWLRFQAMGGSAAWSLSYTPDGSILAVGGDDGGIRLFDTRTLEIVQTLTSAHEDVVYALVFSPDGRRLASAGGDEIVKMWTFREGNLIPDTALLLGRNVVFSPNGMQLATGGLDGTVSLYDTTTNTLITSLVGHSDWVRGLSYSPDGRQLVSASADGSLRLWSIQSGVEIRPAETAHRGAIWAVAFSPDGQFIASGGTDNLIVISSASPYPLLSIELYHQQTSVLAVAYDGTGKWLASAGGNPANTVEENAIILWDPTSGQQQFRLVGHTQPVTALAFAGDILLSASGDSTLILWDSRTGNPRGAALTGHTAPVLTADISPDAATIVSGGGDGLLLWNTVTRQYQRLADESIGSVDFSPDGNTFVAGHETGQVTLWQRDGTLMLRQSDAHTDEVTAVRFSSDGSLLATGSREGNIRLWDARSLQPISQPLVFNGQGVLNLALSSQGNLLAASYRDNSIVLWDTTAGRVLGLPFGSVNDWVTGLVFSPDGQTLAAGSFDGHLLLWDIGLGHWQQQACRTANRQLTPVEWDIFLSGFPYQPVPCGAD